jgi:hypothetical protein
MKSWKLALLALTTAALSATVGCSSSSTPTTTDKDAGETKDSGSTDKDGGGSGGQTGFACDVPADNYCFLYSDLPAASESAEKTACTTSLKGTTSSSCPSAKVVGCCTTKEGGFTTEECYYSGGTTAYTTAEVKTICSSGTFSMTP